MLKAYFKVTLVDDVGNEQEVKVPLKVAMISTAGPDLDPEGVIEVTISYYDMVTFKFSPKNNFYPFPPCDDFEE